MENTQKRKVATRKLPDGRIVSRDALWPELRSRYESGECSPAALAQLYNIPRVSIVSKMKRDKLAGFPWTKQAYAPPPPRIPQASLQSIDKLVQWREDHFIRYQERFMKLRELLDKVGARLKVEAEPAAKEVQTLVDAERKLHEMERTHLGLDQVQENREGLGDISGLGLFDGANITIQPAIKSESQAQCVEVESHVTQEPA